MTNPAAHLRLALAGTLVVAALAGCGSGDGSSDVDRAKAQVSAKEKALSDAQEDFAAKSDEFCGASESYITALDRYGDVLTHTAVTVGDVRDAGSDLEQPQDEVMSAAEAAVEAQGALADAELELAEAQAALAAAKNPGSATGSPPPATSSPTPLAPAATVNRVEKAETELAAVQRGISDDTPLSQAAEQFNAAVVALEMAWLRLFADAGCLTDDQQVQAEKAVRDYTTALQTSLSEAGYYGGEVDGVYGPATVDAVETLQKSHGLPTTGTVDKATADALQDDLAAAGGAAAQGEVASTAAVQQTLKLAGFWDGPVDGVWTPALTQALQDFQTQLGVKPTGTVDAATIAALEKALAQAQLEPSASPSASAPSEPDSSTAEPSPEPTEPTTSPSAS